MVAEEADKVEIAPLVTLGLGGIDLSSCPGQ